MNKYIIGAGIVVAIFIVGSSYLPMETGNFNAARVTSPITVLEGSYDFGDIDIYGGKVQTTYTLKNEGTEDVVVTTAQTSCMCTEGEIAGLTFGMHSSDVEDVVIRAGESETVTAIYDPLAHGPNGTGKVTRELILETDSDATPVVRLKFNANVVKKEE